MIRPPRILALALAALLTVVLAGCDNSGGDPSTSVATTGPDGSNSTSSTTSTTPPITSLDPSEIPGTHSASISDDVDRTMRSDIGTVILEVEEMRALPFLSIPTVTILDEGDFTARVEESVSGDLDPAELAVDEAFFQLMGMLDDDIDLYELLVGLYGEQVLGFYDPATQEMVVPASADGFTPFQRIVVAHELVHALTDQHFEYADVIDLRVTEGLVDDYTAALGVVEGDATYQQFLYLENMDPADAVQAALESLSFDTSIADSAPGWLVKDLSFPYEHGLVFITELVADGGLKAVDGAYQDLPTTTEQILEPRKYLRREEPTPMDAVDVSLSGWEVHADASWGEWGVRLLLDDTLTPGLVTQAAAGWDNDRYRVLFRDDDVAMAWHYRAESEADAEDLVNALIKHAKGPMGASSATESGGGLLLDGAVTVFIDRVGDEFWFVASTDRAAVGELRTQLGI